MTMPVWINSTNPQRYDCNFSKNPFQLAKSTRTKWMLSTFAHNEGAVLSHRMYFKIFHVLLKSQNLNCY